MVNEGPLGETELTMKLCGSIPGDVHRTPGFNCCAKQVVVVATSPARERKRDNAAYFIGPHDSTFN
jgi:hypothetical protein